MLRHPSAYCSVVVGLLLTTTPAPAEPAANPSAADEETRIGQPVAPQQKNADRNGNADVIDVEVRGQRAGRGEEISPAELQEPRHASTGDALAELPGVAVVRRGAGAAEPTIRGLGWERVVTQVGMLPLYGACPGRMDPPVNYVRPHGVHHVSVIQALPSVTLGPATTGGRIVVRPDYERSSPSAQSIDGWTGWKADSSRRGFAGDGGVRGALGPFDFSAGAETIRMRDYRSPSGAQIPARQAEWSMSESLAYHPGEGHRLWHAVSYVHHDELRYPALPMDLERTDYWQIHGGYRYRGEANVREASLELGLMDADHEMSNRSKPNRPTLHAHTASTSRAYAGRAAAVLSLGPAGTLRTGVDAAALERDALRTRDLQSVGRQFEDPIWPDASQTQRGLFGEWTSPRWHDLELRAGGRIDSWRQRIRKAHAPGLGGRPVREGYAAFYGEDAADVVRSDLLGAANALLSWTPAAGLELEIGTGWSSRAPSITERYFAFAPAPGGFLVGNPDLLPERKIEVDGAMRWESEWLDLALSGYAARLDDYVLPTALARIDVNGDGQLDTVRGFRNVEARLLGGEARAEGHIGRFVSVPVTVAAVYGQNRSDGRPLPEIPPWELTGEVRLNVPAPAPWWVRVGARVVRPQNRVDASFPENPTDGFALLHMRTAIRLFEQLHLGFDVENLLDTEYHEHLTRELVFPTEQLPAGSELPAPGRTMFVSARWSHRWTPSQSE